MIYSILLILLAAFGVFETLYLINKRRKKQKPICVGPHDCDVVLQSKYNKTFSIHNDLLGLVFYLFAILTQLLLLWPGCRFPEFVLGAFLFALLVSLIMSIRFVYLMAFTLQSWCSWCIGSAVTVLLMTLVVIIAFWA